jgi:hypothetical protein
MATGTFINSSIPYYHCLMSLFYYKTFYFNITRVCYYHTHSFRILIPPYYYRVILTSLLLSLLLLFNSTANPKSSYRFIFVFTAFLPHLIVLAFLSTFSINTEASICLLLQLSCFILGAGNCYSICHRSIFIFLKVNSFSIEKGLWRWVLHWNALIVHLLNSWV